MWRFRREREQPVGERKERGQALVEFAVTLPLLMILLFAIIETTDALHSYLAVVGSARDGARLGSRGGATNGEVASLVLTDLGGLRNPTTLGDITVTNLTVSGKPAIRVRACHDHKLLVKYPLLPLPDPIRVCSTTTMRVLVL
jgi:Flp pilus assembly protein TadG